MDVLEDLASVIIYLFDSLISAAVEGFTILSTVLYKLLIDFAPDLLHFAGDIISLGWQWLEIAISWTSHWLLACARVFSQLMVIFGNVLSGLIITVAEWLFTMTVLTAELFKKCVQSVLSLPWKSVFDTVTSILYQSLTSMISLLHKHNLSDIEIGALITYLLKIFAILLLIIIISISIALFLYFKYCRRTHTTPDHMIRQPPSPTRTHDDREETPIHELLNDDTTPAAAAAVPQDESKTLMQQLEEEQLRRRVSQLSDALSKERDKTTCVVCLDAKREVLLKPCNHFCLCVDCMQSLNTCPICTRRIRNHERIYNA